MGLVRYVLFCLVFAIGAGAVALSILADELRDYYNSKCLLQRTELENETIKSLTTRYESQIRQIQKDPNILRRLELVTLGIEQTAENTAFPKVSDEQLAAADRVLLEQSKLRQITSDMPPWIQRCSEPNFRRSLFFAGAGLVFVAFIFFAAPQKKTRTHHEE